jgi:DNA-directed RNA polymerase specialized sigma24 family protein
VLPQDFARRFHAAQQRVETAERQRDALVIEARETASLREIAEALGISHTMVAKIVARATRRDNG